MESYRKPLRANDAILNHYACCQLLRGMQNVDVAWYCGHVNVPAEMIPTSVAGPIVLLRNHNIFTYGSVTYILGMAPHLRNVRNIISTIGLNEARHRDNDILFSRKSRPWHVNLIINSHSVHACCL